MKSYTDLEQSKKLTEILPIESADMCFNISQRSNMPPLMTPYSKFNEFFNMETPDFLMPCWSLAALFNYIKDKCGYFELVYLNSTIDGRANILKNVYRLSADIYDVYENELIDACYEMILKLHEQKLL